MKSHFQFSNKQRSGILFLVVVILSLQLAYHFIDSSKDEMQIEQKEIQPLRLEIDSLRQVEIENNKPKVYKFNPNYITDYKGYTLGMSNEEIDRLHKFRAKNKWVNSASDFQEVTKVSDSLLEVISPYFKFPDWVTNPKVSNRVFKNKFSNSSKPKSYAQKIDLNRADARQLQMVYGVGEKLSKRIIDYRSKFKNGFASDIELSEVWGLEPEVIERIKNNFTVKTPRTIVRFNLNTATRDELVTIQYIDYEVANNIIEERILRDGFKSFEELTKVEDFPIKKIDIIKLYLYL